jgi:hypothetical protein
MKQQITGLKQICRDWLKGKARLMLPLLHHPVILSRICTSLLFDSYGESLPGLIHSGNLSENDNFAAIKVGKLREVARIRQNARNSNEIASLRGKSWSLKNEAVGIRTRDLRIKSPLLYLLSYSLNIGTYSSFEPSLPQILQTTAIEKNLTPKRPCGRGNLQST